MTEQNENGQEIHETKKNTFEVAGDQVLNTLRDLIKQGNVRRVIIRTQEDRVLLDTPLTGGAGVGGVLALMGGLRLMLVTAVVAALARVKVEVVREVREGDVFEERNRVKIDVDENASNDDESAST